MPSMRCIFGIVIPFLLATTSKAFLRGLESPEGREMHYWYDVDFEADLVDGDKPDDETMVCIERSMATHMNHIAQTFFDEHQQPQTQPEEATKWAVEKITFEPEFAKIVLIVESNDTATVKVIKDGEPNKVEQVVLEETPPSTQRLRRMQDWYRHLKNGKGNGNAYGHTKGNGNGRGNGGNNGRRRGWYKGRMNTKSRCRHCPHDNTDYGRKLNGVNGVNFETIMNVQVRDAVCTDCEGVIIRNSTFSLVKQGAIVRTSDPEYTESSDSESSEEEESAPEPQVALGGDGLGAVVEETTPELQAVSGGDTLGQPSTNDSSEPEENGEPAEKAVSASDGNTLGDSVESDSDLSEEPAPEPQAESGGDTLGQPSANDSSEPEENGEPTVDTVSNSDGNSPGAAVDSDYEASEEEEPAPEPQAGSVGDILGPPLTAVSAEPDAEENTAPEPQSGSGGNTLDTYVEAAESDEEENVAPEPQVISGGDTVEAAEPNEEVSPATEPEAAPAEPEEVETPWGKFKTLSSWLKKHPGKDSEEEEEEPAPKLRSGSGGANTGRRRKSGSN